MLHAIVRSRHEAIHFIGDLNGYNLQTLQQHARGALRDGGDVRVDVELDESDAPTWKQYARRWLDRMNRAGVAVFVCGDRPPAGADQSAGVA